MEEKLVALVIIALFVGLGGGYGLGYVIYQPQIRSLNSALDVMQLQFMILNSTLQTILGNQSNLLYFDKLQFISAYGTGGTPGNYTIYMTIKNIGNATATLGPTTVFYDGIPSSSYTGDGPVCSFASLTLDPGSQTTGNLTMFAGTYFVSGMSLEVMIQTASGSQFPKVMSFHSL